MQRSASKTRTVQIGGREATFAGVGAILGRKSWKGAAAAVNHRVRAAFMAQATGT